MFTNKIKISFVHFRKPHQIRLAKNCSGLNGFGDPSWLLFADEDVISFNFNKASFLSYSSLFSSQRASAAKLSKTTAARLRFFGVLCGSLGSHSTGNPPIAFTLNMADDLVPQNEITWVSLEQACDWNMFVGQYYNHYPRYEDESSEEECEHCSRQDLYFREPV